MTYSVYQHWDPLEVCIVGRSYPPEFYQYIQNTTVRKVFERIAEETEEDYQKLIVLLKSFGVEILRPMVGKHHDEYLIGNTVLQPPMTPRDYSAMLGETFYFGHGDGLKYIQQKWHECAGNNWPSQPPMTREDVELLPKFIKDELMAFHSITTPMCFWDSVLEKIPNTTILNAGINSAMTSRIGKDLYFGTASPAVKRDIKSHLLRYQLMFPQYRSHIIDTQGHSDGTYCPVKPGLIITLRDVSNYAKTFPGWEIIELPNQSWDKVKPFLQIKQKNKGKWWVPGEELNDDFTDFVETWMSHWVGYVEETVFDVNMLVIDEHNVVCNNYNKDVFDAFERHGITPHIVNFRHRYFWDGGLHCITSDVSRRGGIMNDYFPERNR